MLCRKCVIIIEMLWQTGNFCKNEYQIQKKQVFLNHVYMTQCSSKRKRKHFINKILQTPDCILNYSFVCLYSVKKTT